MKLKVLIVDDHQILREGLVALLAERSEFQVVGHAADGRTAVALAGELQPDVVVMDVAMPELNGIEATRQMLARAPKVRVLALSMHADKRFVTGMLRAGAWGYVLKCSGLEELLLALRALARGHRYLSPAVTHLVIEEHLTGGGEVTVTPAALLTPREREVLQLMAEGKATKTIAARLHVSVKTIESHRKQIMEKLKLRSVAELTKYAIREGLTTLEH